ncbi:FAR-17a/AIG1-like protein [Entamoeba marina]
MYDSNYSFVRMTRFWTYFGMFSCAGYFTINFFRQLSLFFLYETKPKVLRKKQQKETRLMHYIIELSQQAAIAIALSVSLMFWVLYFKSPSTVFRMDNDWQPTIFEEMYYTHFEHTFPLMFLLIDCLIFKQGNKRVKQVYNIAKFGSYVIFHIYSSIVLYDYFYYNIRPYPFMDSWNLYGLVGFMLSMFFAIASFFNPTAYFIRKYVKIA